LGPPRPPGCLQFPAPCFIDPTGDAPRDFPRLQRVPVKWNRRTLTIFPGFQMTSFAAICVFEFSE
jgi:hypothetical protein